MIAIRVLVVSQNMFDDEVSVEAHAKEGRKVEEENRFRGEAPAPFLNAIEFKKSAPLWSSPLHLSLFGTNNFIKIKTLQRITSMDFSLLLCTSCLRKGFEGLCVPTH